MTLVKLRCIIYTAMVARLETGWPDGKEMVIGKSGAGYGNVNEPKAVVEGGSRRRIVKTEGRVRGPQATSHERGQSGF